MRDEKQLLLDEVKDKIEESKGFIVAGYQGFSATKSRQFRDKMAEIGGEFEVVRKRVFAKAAAAAGIQFNVDTLHGHIGVIFAHDDPTQVVKHVVKYGEDNNEAITVLGGQIEGEICTAEDVIALSKLPNLPEMRSQLLGLFEAPMSQMVGTVQAILTSIIYCIEEKSKKD